MKSKRFSPILACSLAILLIGCGNGGDTPEPTPFVKVTTGAADIADFTTVTLNGSFAQANTDVTSTGFIYGTTPDMDNDTEAAANVNGNFSVTITLEAGIKYYYSAYAVADGTVFNGEVLTFTTAPINRISGKEWIELPEYTVSPGQTAKAYYATMKDNNTGRNYSILYDNSRSVALWVAFPMNYNTHLAASNSVSASWKYDTSGDIPRNAQPNVAASSYKDEQGNTSSYQRGHQIARADRTGSSDALKQTYTATNSTPQLGSFNGGIWSTLEGEIRKIITTSPQVPQDTLYVVTGPLMISQDPDFAYDYDGKECPIPDAYFKVVLWSKYNPDATRSYDSIGFILENKAGQSNYANYALPVSSVEQQTGYTFFGNLNVTPSEMSAIKSTSTWASFATR